MTLTTLITNARQRQEARSAAAQQYLADEAAARRQSWIDRLEREIAHAFPAELIAALDLIYRTQDDYPQCYALFAHRGVDIGLAYTAEHEGGMWYLFRLQDQAGRHFAGDEIIEGTDQVLFADALLLTIHELAPDYY